MTAHEQVAADLKAITERQAKRNPKATVAMDKNIKAVELNTYLNRNANRYHR